jgi:hypothetical protein
MRKPLAVGLALAVPVVASTVLARPRVPQAVPDAVVAAQHRPEPPRALEFGSRGVRLLLGVGDTASADWSGAVILDRGAVLGVEGVRFRAGDGVAGPAGWTARSLPIRRVAAAKKAAGKKAAAKKAINRAEERGGPSNSGAAITPTGVVARLDAPGDATLTVRTAQGEAAIPLGELQGADGLPAGPRRYLDGRIEAELVPPHAPLAATELQEDFPAAAPDGQGGAWVAYVAHAPRGPDASEALVAAPASFRGFIPEGGGDGVVLVHYRVRDGRGEAGPPRPVTPPGRDVWRPAVAVDASGVTVVWSEQQEGNWDLYARRLDPASGAFDEPRRLTTDPGADTAPALAVAADGRVHVAWQGWRGGQAEVLLAPIDGTAEPLNVSDHPANDWSPALAADPSGGLAVAFDTYRNGNYDVMLFRSPSRGPAGPIAVADSPRFEARPSLAVDRQGRAWVAYEERPANWGKDFGNIPDGPGDALYQASAVRVRCIDGGRVLDAGDPVAQAPEPRRVLNAFARLTLDAGGRPRLLFRHRQEAIWGGNAVMVVGAVWLGLGTSLVGDRWTPPQPLPRSDNLLDNRPALVPLPDGDVLAVYSTDGRLHREVEHTPDLTRRFYSHSGTPPGVVNNDLFVAALGRLPAGAAAPAPGGPVAAAAPAPAVHPDESAAVARLREHRVAAGGKTYQLLRGEFHRHTELSQDGGNDGALEDMWRYALDAAAFDWIGNGDHDNGGGKEYTWWLVQKTTDLYHHAPRFMPMFTYERSVAYPGGHRNVMFPHRGVRTLPRLVDEVGVRTGVRGVDEDAAMLFRYLNELGGLCASHTSGTGMGTDWRANDPDAEPIVEIYQGIRNSYEYFGGPRAAHGPGDAIGGWRPLGMVWNALAYQYRLGFQASSDHVSTHISYAVALAEEPTRRGVFDAFKRRHCYAATDNILLDVRCGEHVMGDEFAQEGPVALKVLAHGTAPIARVDIIKDFHHAYTAEPKAERVAFTWTDEGSVNRDPSWYYVRVVQEDGEVAWGSPMWVHPPGARVGAGR